MKSGRCLAWVAVVAAVASLSMAALAELNHSGIGVGWRSPFGILRLISYCAGAVGVVLLGLTFHRLAGAVTSMATQLTSTGPDACSRSELQPVRELAEAVASCLSEQVDRNRRLEDELKNSRIRAGLAERQKRHTEAIIYSLRDAVIVIDESDRLLMANKPAERLFQFDAEQVHHNAIVQVCEDHAEFVEFLKQCVKSRAEGTRREMMFLVGQRPCTFDAIVSCVHENDRVVGAVAVLHDITREKEVSQMKNDFVSHVSHELKTPLASIMAYSEMLADGEADDEETQKEFYGVIQSQAQRLNRLIEDILNVSRIESGLIKVNKEPVSLTILIEQQMQMIKGFAEEKQITVTGQKPIIYDQVYADKDMISQVVVNLLSNAVKYTPTGGSVKITTEVDETASLARVAVTDTGVGIPEDEVEHVFDKFYRVSANNKQAKGTGLGLNLVKQIVEKVHNGRVFVTSHVGVGSTFGFELPLAAGALAETA